jgi:hypothetical protein
LLENYEEGGDTFCERRITKGLELFCSSTYFFPSVTGLSLLTPFHTLCIGIASFFSPSFNVAFYLALISRGPFLLILKAGLSSASDCDLMNPFTFADEAYFFRPAFS